jgi:hypothetical protein
MVMIPFLEAQLMISCALARASTMGKVKVVEASVLDIVSARSRGFMWVLRISNGGFCMVYLKKGSL